MQAPLEPDDRIMSLTIPISVEVNEALKTRARRESRSVTKHVQHLIMLDLHAANLTDADGNVR